MPQEAQTLVRGFAGENRLLADDLLPDNISPDAQNVDYSSGSLKKRKGFSKIHQGAIVSGGVRVENVSNNRAIVIPDSTVLDLAGDYTLEVFITFSDSGTSNAQRLITKISGSSAWRLSWRAGVEQWSWLQYDSGAVAKSATIAVAAMPMVLQETYHLVASRSGTTNTLTIIRLSNGDSATATVTCSGNTNGSNDVIIGAADGATPGNTTQDILVDELRIWSDVRTSDELTDARFRELNEEEVLDANLVGYWKMNEGFGSIVEDASSSVNPASLFGQHGSSVLGLVPLGSGDDFAVRFNGADGRGTLAYRSDFAPVLNTGTTWTIEAWLKLDSAVGISDSRFLALGDFDIGGAGTDGSPFTIFVDSSLNLKYSFSTTTTHVNTTQDTTYNVVVGVPFHVALVRGGDSILTYINGVLVDTLTGVTSENGPTTDTTVGLTLGHMIDDGAASSFCPCTVDEVRLWSVDLSGRTIFSAHRGEGASFGGAGLLAHLHFNAGTQTVDEVDPDATVTFLPAGDQPVWTRGLVYPLNPEPLALAAPLTQFVDATDVNSGRSQVHHEVLIATRTDFWAIQGAQEVHLAELVAPNAFNDLYTHALYRNHLICMNSLGRNYRYDARGAPVSLTLPTWTDSVLATPSTGSGWPLADGEYKYRFAWYDENNLIEGLFGGEDSAVLATASHDEVDITSIVSSLPGYPNVTHVRIYRQDPASTVFRFHSAVAIGTTTATDTGTDLSGNDAVNTRRGHPDPQSICAVYKNRLFLAKESGVIYSEADTEDFPSTNQFNVDVRDGDEITGMWAAFGGLVIWKQNSIHFLTGSGETSFTLIKLLEGVGCVSHNTIAQSPTGIYFLGQDGVYRFDGRQAIYKSHSQQPEFLKLDRTLARNAAGVYDIGTHQYIVSFDQIEKGTGSFYDLEPELYTHYWKFKDATDETGVATDLIVHSSVTFPRDAIRGIIARTTNATESNLQTTDNSVTSPSSSADTTIGLWHKSSLNNIGAAFGIFMRMIPAPSFQIISDFAVPGGSFGVIGNNAGLTGGGSITFGQQDYDEWHHYVLTKKGTVMSFYVDGVFVGSDGSASSPTWNTIWNDVWFGGATFNTTQGDWSNAFVIVNAALPSSRVLEIYMNESTFVDKRTRATFSFDEEAQAWAKWDKDFDTLVLAEQTSRQNDVLGGRNGFVNKLLDSDRDGAGFILGGALGSSGSLASESGPLVTDSNNTFPTTGDGLAGVDFVAVPSDASLAIQKKTILFNTATVLHLSAPLVPAVTGTYFIGPIDLHWESRWMDMGDPSIKKRWFKFFFLVKEQSATVTLKHKTTEFETFVSTTFSTADEFVTFLANNNGRRLKLLFEHITTDETFELQSFQTIFERKDLV